MIRQQTRICLIGSLMLIAPTSRHALAGPYPAFDEVGVAPADIIMWASQLVDYSPAPGVMDTPAFDGGDPVPNDDPLRALGPSDEQTVSLGDLDESQLAAGMPPGSITVAFDGPLSDGPGPDFAVFENAGSFFGGPFVFAELGFVEVSSNGNDFARFPAASLNDPPPENPDFDPTIPEAFPDNTRFLAVPHERDTPALDASFGRSFAGLNTTNVFQLAGTHPAGSGTPFDLAQLADHALVQNGQLLLDAVRFVRIIDIPGNGSVVDGQQRPIYDGWVTVISGGIDIDAVGAIHGIPEPANLTLMLAALTIAASTFQRRRAAEKAG